MQWFTFLGIYRIFLNGYLAFTLERSNVQKLQIAVFQFLFQFPDFWQGIPAVGASWPSKCWLSAPLPQHWSSQAEICSRGWHLKSFHKSWSSDEVKDWVTLSPVWFVSLLAISFLKDWLLYLTSTLPNSLSFFIPFQPVIELQLTLSISIFPFSLLGQLWWFECLSQPQCPQTQFGFLPQLLSTGLWLTSQAPVQGETLLVSTGVGMAPFSQLTYQFARVPWLPVQV